MPDTNPKPESETQQPDTAIDIGGEDDDNDEDDIFDDDDNDDEEEEEENDDVPFEPATPRSVRLKMDTLVRSMLTGPVPVHVHDVIIKGSTNTKGDIIGAEESEALKKATTMQDLLRASNDVNSRLKSLGLFDLVTITIDSGPPEIPEAPMLLLRLRKRRVGCGERLELIRKLSGRINLVQEFVLWDGSIAYSFDRATEVSAGVYLPRLRTLVAPVTVRAYMLTQDLRTFSSFKERSVGLSLGLYSDRYQNLDYHLAWRNLAYPSRTSSSSVRMQLGHDYPSSLKYTLKVDKRDSPLRPTQGFAFVAKTHISGLAPGSQSLRFLHQEFDLRCAIPLGFYRATLNFGISSGVLFPWGSRFLNRTTTQPEKFFLGGNLSPVCALGGLLKVAVRGWFNARTSLDLPFSSNVAQAAGGGFNSRVPARGANSRGGYGYRGAGGRMSGRGRGGRTKIQCQICGKIGHLATRCWYRFDEEFQAEGDQEGQVSGQVQLGAFDDSEEAVKKDVKSAPVVQKVRSGALPVVVPTSGASRNRTRVEDQTETQVGPVNPTTTTSVSAPVPEVEASLSNRNEASADVEGSGAANHNEEVPEPQFSSNNSGQNDNGRDGGSFVGDSSTSPHEVSHSAPYEDPHEITNEGSQQVSTNLDQAENFQEGTGASPLEDAEVGSISDVAERMNSEVSPFRSSAGVGIVIPASRFRMELNYCYTLKKFSGDNAKAGFWLTFSHPS
ncbi:hypothetical protein HRI_004688900 [Hibiscus trionum]|uniref:CCHC-type domain-containing protein n=1 Tax=Hibiscus trionum TaxID=183268 RepID=A0A9W7MRM0_HIBTR|nr:hypothetical protein HRI_004688900 [Hibiscus trionum]